ncbi:hypothetical protein Hdeb2414_s0013g00413301 [Helianthus debilis subsp. tardiflorus]
MTSWWKKGRFTTTPAFFLFLWCPPNCIYGVHIQFNIPNLLFFLKRLGSGDPGSTNVGPPLTREELMTAANLAMRCLNMKGMYRPTMKEVSVELETIRTSHMPPTVQSNTSHMMYAEDFSMITYGESSSTFPSFNENITH